MKIEVVGQVWKSLANGMVYAWGGVSPTICVGAHSGVQPKIIYTIDMEQAKSKLNRYVRYIYRKMQRLYGVEKVREDALEVFVLTQPELARIRKEESPMFSTEFIKGILDLCGKWAIPTKYFNETLCGTIYTAEEMEQVLLDLTPVRVRIRKLTPRECGRLQGVSDEDISKIEGAGISNSQAYKLYGNSICVPVIEGIFTQLFRQDQDALF